MSRETYLGFKYEAPGDTEKPRRKPYMAQETASTEKGAKTPTA